MGSPFKTITKATTKATQPGDLVLIRTGIYNERVVISNSGTPGNYITYKSYNNEAVIIDGTSISQPPPATPVTDWWGLIELKSNYIQITGLKVQNSIANGVFGSGGVANGVIIQPIHDIIISKCTTVNTHNSGIGMHFGYNITIDGNDVSYANNGGGQENISVESIDNFKISKNTVHDGAPDIIKQKNGNYNNQGGEGIDAKGASNHGKIIGNKVYRINCQGIYVDAGSNHLSNVEVYNNIVYSNVYAGITIGNEVYGTGPFNGVLENVYVYNNIVFMNEWVGINIGGNTTGDNTMKSVYIFNNTVVKNGWQVHPNTTAYLPDFPTPAQMQGAWAVGISNENSQITADLVIRNNIIDQVSGNSIQSVQLTLPYTIESNLINSNAPAGTNNPTYVLPSTVFVADYDNPPVSPFAASNFKLKTIAPASLATGKGINSPETPGFDFIYKSRANPVAVVDIGAYQH